MTQELSEWESSLPHVLWRTQNAVHRLAQESIDDLGVTVTQLGLAVHLHERGPMSASDLSRGFRITPQSVTTALGQLQTRGWVQRESHPVHGRVILHRLTESGLAGVHDGRERMRAVTARVVGTLADQDAAPLLAGLRRILVDLEGEHLPTAQLWPVQSA